MKKKTFLILILSFLFIPSVSAAELVSCGNTEGIPASLVNLVRFGVTLIKYLVPVLIIVFGSIDFFKATFSGDSDMLAKTFKQFGRKLIAGALVFLLIVIFQTAISLVSSDDSVMQCVSCFMSDKSDCTYYEKETEEPILDDPTDGVHNDEEYDDPSSGGSSSDNYNIFVGDSRFNGMRMHLGLPTKTSDTSNEIVIANDGETYSFIDDSLSKIDDIITEKGDDYNYNIIINLGVNDITRTNDYIDKYNKLAKGKWKDYNIIVVSLNPINDSMAVANKYSTKNYQVIDFNDDMKFIGSKASNLSYCNTYSKIINNFKTIDGIHYTKETNREIYNHIVNNCLK